jgi:DNA-binding CsgD family transcriptional regulator
MFNEKITHRELEALKLYNLGYSRMETAEEMGISATTVAWYLKEVRDKFNVRTRKELRRLEHVLRSGGQVVL